MTNIPSDNILIANGDYQPVKNYIPGTQVVVELTGTFASGTVTPGFVSSDETPVFVADGSAVTAAGRVTIKVPKSRKPALQVASATGSTEILATFSILR